MPFLPVIKAEVKKKKTFTVGNVTFSEDFGAGLGDIANDYEDWKADIDKLGKAEVGIVGKNNEAMKNTKKAYMDTLLEYVENHVTAGVARPGRGERDLSKRLKADLDRIITDRNVPLMDEDEHEILNLIEKLEDMGEHKSKANPKNIVFTQPVRIIEDGVDEDGKKKYKKSFDTEKVYGHYRTPRYIEMREKVYGVTEKIPAVPTDWYSEGDIGNNTPPFWQALFASSSLGEKKGGKVTKGLLGILEDFEKAIDDPPPTKGVIIRDKGQMKQRIETLYKFPALVSHVKKILKNSNIYKGGNQGHIIVFSKLKDAINNQIYAVGGKTNKEYITALFEGVDKNNLPIALRNIQSFYIHMTDATIRNFINGNKGWSPEQSIRGQDVMAPNGKPFTMGDRAIEGYSWYKNFHPVKKSWVDMLWR